MAAPIGGQAVLEGVMMRGPTAWSLAVRKPNGEIAEVNRPIHSALLRHRWLRLPVVRGVIALGESLAIGFRALAISANYAAQEEGKEGEETELTKGQLIFAFAIAIGFAIMLFKVSPALITNWLPIESTGWFVIVEGVIRVGIFVAYLSLISLLPDLRRVFQYHAAEHKAINAYESGGELEPETVQRYSLIHVRCGTAFLLYVMVIAIFVFAFFGRPAWYWLIASRILLLPVIAGLAYEADAELEPETVQRYSLIHVRCGTAFLLYVMVIAIFVFAFFGRPAWYWLIASRILLLPVIAGLAYEVIRFAGKHPTNTALRTLLAPGLWLQRLTTRQPTLDQIEVSIRALSEVLRLEGRLTAEERKVEVMA